MNHNICCCCKQNFTHVGSRSYQSQSLFGHYQGVKSAAQLSLTVLHLCLPALTSLRRRRLTFNLDELYAALESIRCASEDYLLRDEMRLSGLGDSQTVLSGVCECFKDQHQNRLDDGVFADFMQENFLFDCLRLLQARLSTTVRVEQRLLRHIANKKPRQL